MTKLFLEDVLKKRRSIRKFKKEKIDLALIREVVEAGRWAPSACNMQHWEFVVITDEKKIKNIYEKAGGQNIIKNAPAIIAVFFHKELNSQNYANIQSASAAVQNMLLKAYELGLGTCWVCGFGDKKEIKKLLKAPENFELLCLVLIGKPLEEPYPPPSRRPLSKIIYLNEFSPTPPKFPTGIRTSLWDISEVLEYQKYSSRAGGLGKDYEKYDAEEIEAIRETLKKILPRDKLRILSLYSYDGTILKKIMKIFENHEMFDLELSKEACLYIESKVGYMNFSVGALKLPFKKESFDIIVAIFSLEKIPQWEKLIEDSYFFLKRNGKMIIFFKNSISLYGLIYLGIEKILKVRDVQSFYSSGPFEPINSIKLKKILVKYGFYLKTKGFFLVPPDVLIYSKKIDRYLKRHGKEISHFKFLLKYIASILVYLFRITKRVRLTEISSTMLIIAEKIDNRYL